MHPSDATISMLTALNLPKVGPGTIRKLLNQQNLHLTASLQESVDRISVSFSPAQTTEAVSKTSDTIERCEKLSIHIISVLDEEYPRALLEVSDFPPVLYVKGSAALWSMPCVAVVGTREASPLGLSYAKQTAATFATAGFCVVSGLALGIDTAAHLGALSVDGATIAVLAHGLDSVSPSSNRPLAEAILEKNGALVSEHPPGVRPYAPEFVRRNRIQSGLSRASIMVESGETGGSIHQARFTKQQKRRLFAIFPKKELGEQYNFRYSGAQILQSEFGAEPIETKEDVLSVAAELLRK